MRRALLAGAALVLIASACAGAGGERTIFVDYSHDEFNSFFLFNFPKKISVHPGTELVFKQTWTGEPHTVTGGTLVNAVAAKGAAFIELFDSYEGLVASGAALPDPENPGDATMGDLAAAVAGAKDRGLVDTFTTAYNRLREKHPSLAEIKAGSDVLFSEGTKVIDEESEKVFESGLPWALEFNDETHQQFAAQNAGQPCYLTKGKPPKDPTDACKDAQQEQPEFDGSHRYYNSGIIPFEGQGGNTYRVPLADDIEPGKYWFYCAVHGYGQSTEVEVKPNGEQVQTQEEIEKQARKEIAKYSAPLEKLYKEVTGGKKYEFEGRELEPPYAGLFEPSVGHAAINEMVPRSFKAKAGEPITWNIMGLHSISFDVPDYFPVVQFLENGKVRLNPKLQPPAGGSRDLPPPPEEGVYKVDGGTYDGEGFWSSGLVDAFGGAEYTMRISKPDTYRYACLIHPPMVGTLEVTA